MGLEVIRLIHKYKVHELFFQFIKDELAKLSEKASALSTPVTHGLHELVLLLKYLQDKDSDVQTYHSKRIANLMADLYISIIALKDMSTGDFRQQLITKLFFKHTWEKSLIDTEMIAVNYFDLICPVLTAVNPSPNLTST